MSNLNPHIKPQPHDLVNALLAAYGVSPDVVRAFRMEAGGLLEVEERTGWDDDGQAIVENRQYELIDKS